MTRTLLTLSAALVFLSGLPFASGAATTADPVIATAGPTKIKASDFRYELENLPANLKTIAATPEGRREMLDTIIVREMILLEAKKANIEHSPGFARKLEDVKKRLIVEMFLKQKVEATVTVTDAEMLEYYKTNPDFSTGGEEVRISQILVADDVVAEGLVAKIKAGSNFEELVKKYSTDKYTNATGGDVGWVIGKDLDPGVAEVAYSLTEGQVSGVIKADDGFHIIKNTGKRNNFLYPFEEMKDQIKKTVTDAKNQAAFDQVKEDLKKKVKFNINEKELEKLAN